MKISTAMMWIAAAFMTVLVGVSDASAASKLLVNNSDVIINVRLFPRIGAEPSDGQSKPVRVKVLPNASVLVNYGDDNNPFVNELFVKIHSGGAAVAQSFKVSIRGSSLDNLFNTNNTFSLDYDPAAFQFSIAGSNT